MKLSDAAQLCEGNARAFAEVYKIYNYKDDDDLRAYCDFVTHEPVEWMRGFPAAWKSVGLFSKPRAAFHRLLRASSVVEELGAEYCENVHTVIWNAFKGHMDTILEKRAGAVKKPATAAAAVAAAETESDRLSVESDALTAESVDVIEPVPCVPVRPWSAIIREENFVQYGAETERPLNYKRKYEVLQGVVQTLLSADRMADENVRLRAALATLLSEFGRA
jgi:hypothetical protein